LLSQQQKNSKLKGSFNLNKKSIGHPNVIIALAKKSAIIIWNFITNAELCEDENDAKRNKFKRERFC
jgi:hypothetical protein